jgi:hypothetical protein
VKKLFRAVFLALLLVTAGSRAQAQYPVYDWTNTTQSIMNSADQIRQWNQYLTQYREQFAMMYAVYQGVKDWRTMSWQDMLSVFELPWFDGISGIDDIRNVAGATGMTLDELMTTYNEVDKIHRMMSDPMYLQNQVYQAKCRLWATLYARVVRRRIALTKMHQKYLKQIQALQTQAQSIQANLEAYAGMDPPPTAAIEILHTKLALINAQIAGNKEAIAAQEANIKRQEEQENNDIQDKIASIDDANSTGNLMPSNQ